MILPLEILSCGAVTSIGLNAFQTAAAFRARIAGFESAIRLTPPQEPLRAARIPARTHLKRTMADWLVHLSARAIRESLGYRPINGKLGLVLTIPEKERQHPALAGRNPNDLLREVVLAVGQVFAHACIAGEGGAGIVSSLLLARDLMIQEDLDLCVVGGVDSLVCGEDVARMREAGRMLEPGNPNGLIPGEGSGFVIVALPDRFRGAIARIFNAASAVESNGVLGTSFSQGHAFTAALQSATEDSTVPESNISFRVSTVNGERYAVWESMFFASRFYRTRRERLPVWYTASSIGETGAASGAVALAIAALGIAGGYAPGPYAMCESASETGLRGACLVGPAANAPDPPYRPEGGAAPHILRWITSPIQ